MSTTIRFWHSLRGRLLLGIGLPLLLFNTALTAIEYQQGKADAIAAMEDYLQEMASEHAERIDADFTAIAQVARSAASFMASYPVADDAALQRGLAANLTLQPLIYGSAIAFAPSVRRAAPYAFRTLTDATPQFMDIAQAYDYTGRDWYRLPMQTGTPIWSEPYFDAGAGNVLMVTYSAPLPAAQEGGGVLTVDVSLHDLQPDWPGLWGGYASIVSRQGAYLAHPQQELLRQEDVFATAARLGQPQLAEAGRRMQAGESGLVHLPDPRGIQGQAWLVFAPIPSTGWSLMAVVEEARILAPVQQRLARQVVWAVLAMALVFAALFFLAARFTRPLLPLSAAAQAVRAGDWDARVPPQPGQDEISQFGAVFNSMLDELKAALAARLEAVARRQAVESELQVAREIQLSLLPQERPEFGAVHGAMQPFELHGLCDPAMTMSGDFYDYFRLDADTLALVVADVCGKGLPAALFMAVARTSLRNFSASGRTPAETLAATNAALCVGNAQCMFVTLFYAHYQVSTGLLRYANAGHPPPCVVLASGSAVQLAGSGPLLGALPEAAYVTGEYQLNPGDTLFLYTDGVTEAGSDTQELYGEARLATWLEQMAGLPLAETCQRLAAQVDAYRHQERQDDITLLALRRQVAPHHGA